MRLEIERAPDRQEAFVRVREVLARFEDSPERQDARAARRRPARPAARRPRPASRRGRGGRATGEISPRLLEAGDRLERDALAGVAAHPQLRELLAELSPDHFDAELHRRAREHLLEPGEPDEELVPLLAELDARAATEGIDEETAKELLLRLREREAAARARRRADLERTKELQERAREDPRRRSRESRVAAGYNPPAEHRSPVAQLAEHPAVNRRVVGSSPTRGVSPFVGKRNPAFLHRSGVPRVPEMHVRCLPRCLPRDLPGLLKRAASVAGGDLAA